MCISLHLYCAISSGYLIPEHNISGDVLCLLDPEALKDMGIATIGQRLAILKAVYNVKLAQNIPIESDHYVPPCEYAGILGLGLA